MIEDLQKQIEETKRMTRRVTVLTWIVVALIIARIVDGIWRLAQ